MPLGPPQSPATAEVCADSAYVLFLDKLVLEDATLDADDLAKIKMPNRDGFVSPIRVRASAPNPSSLMAAPAGLR
jgi:S-disulfanyl-L-cysteine oxidoreductase SoxD